MGRLGWRQGCCCALQWPWAWWPRGKKAATSLHHFRRFKAATRAAFSWYWHRSREIKTSGSKPSLGINLWWWLLRPKTDWKQVLWIATTFLWQWYGPESWIRAANACKCQDSEQPLVSWTCIRKKWSRKLDGTQRGDKSNATVVSRRTFGWPHTRLMRGQGLWMVPHEATPPTEQHQESSPTSTALRLQMGSTRGYTQQGWPICEPCKDCHVSHPPSCRVGHVIAISLFLLYHSVLRAHLSLNIQDKKQHLEKDVEDSRF